MSTILTETKRRRTFAIISHPDAGKTTLTEKLLLYGGAIQLAGSVKARRNQRSATSDWMELEKQRGISVTSTVLQFEFEGHVLNLLDTPGHQDFSADTYRTLTAADSAVMLIDNAKGVEAQTRKLFEVCRQRGIPIFTFVNKMDHSGKGPMAAMAELEEVLGIGTTPINWPIGQGPDFKGVYDRLTRKIHWFERTVHGATRATVDVLDFDDPRVPERLGTHLYQTLVDDIELLDVAGDELDLELVRKGLLTPVFFGSALSNFGVEPFLRRFMDMAPAPVGRRSGDRTVTPDEPFSGFVFKIQANMDPQHRDRIAFMRVVSGKFEKDMEVVHTRTGKKLRLTRPQRLFAQERETVEEAYPGDIVGLTNPGAFRLGDTLSVDKSLLYEEVPHFVPEAFAVLENRNVARPKQFEQGVNQLAEEGLIDIFWDVRAQRREPVLGVVGQLQFEVVQFRLRSEYGVETALLPMPFTTMRWVKASPAALEAAYLGTGAKLFENSSGHTVLMANSEWTADYVGKQNKELELFKSQAEFEEAVRGQLARAK